MKTPKQYVRVSLLTEARKVLRGAKTKISEGSLLHALAHDYMLAHSKSKKA